MRPLPYSINVTLDGCCDHRVIPADEELPPGPSDQIYDRCRQNFGRHAAYVVVAFVAGG